MSPDDHFLTNRKQSLIRSKQTPDPSVQFLVNMQTNNYALVDHMRTLTDFKSDTTIITDLNSI